MKDFSQVPRSISSNHKRRVATCLVSLRRGKSPSTHGNAINMASKQTQLTRVWAVTWPGIRYVLEELVPGLVLELLGLPAQQVSEDTHLRLQLHDDAGWDVLLLAPQVVCSAELANDLVVEGHILVPLHPRVEMVVALLLQGVVVSAGHPVFLQRGVVGVVADHLDDVPHGRLVLSD